ncbi:hypothetical protein LTR48_003609 [Friedmanniomyces endolithicus]|uniref:Alpha/beta hydrolase fold-3 domain-containing protein n=1 Tax=Rachicladosporium monterosium TaxID=1507873 RepID=A0ABR0L7K8_9PEZI|nr:hypothetical protein LTR48_003609 [Friedmanniomyces endolithicus]KAK5144750.1 hypothetical protein LTR32_003391 [Rachicladosporium monterosium]
MVRSNEELRQMGTPAPELLAALEKAPFPDLSNGNADASVLDIRQNRANHLAKLRHFYPIPGPIPELVKESLHQVAIRNGSSIRVKVYVPVKHSPESSPLIVMMHEGGWMMGDLTDEDLNCRMFARDLGAVCVNIEYRLAPEHHFPQGVNDCWDVVQWCARNAIPSSNILPADPKVGFIVGGASAGGNLAAVMCQLSRDEGLIPPLTGQYLCVPALLWWDVVPEKWMAEYKSRTDSIFDPVLKLREGKDQTTESLKADHGSSLFCPLLHRNLRGLAPAYFQLAGLDPLRDEGLLYERVLREESGVLTRLEVYEGYGHMFWTNWLVAWSMMP